MEFNESTNKPPTQSEIRLPDEMIIKGANVKVRREKTESDMRALHDKVGDRLARYVKEEEELVK
jgi:hypothetical protein